MFSKQFTVYPKIFRADSNEKTIVIHARQGHGEKMLAAVASCKFIQMDQPIVRENRQWLEEHPQCRFERRENGDIAVFVKMEKEGEYTLLMESAPGEPRPISLTFAFYALKEDLFKLRPYKGDMHVHSSKSDGKETPEFTMSCGRFHGFDFMAITDHEYYEPSLIAVKAAKDCHCDMLVMPGEEIHLPENAVHVINFGAKASINEMVRQDEKTYRAGVAEYMKELPEDMHPVNRFEVAASEWTFDRIRENGGIAIFCHPYWRPQYHGFIAEEVVDTLIDRNKFDAMEVFGGFYSHQWESNRLSLARWEQARADGKNISAVGVSDSHGCENDLFSWYYTIVFADKLEFDSLAAAIRDCRSVAVHKLPEENPVVAGDFRLTKYTYYLLREFYPRHNEICRLEGEIMCSYYREGTVNAPEVIKSLSGSVAKFMDLCWEK